MSNFFRPYEGTKPYLFVSYSHNDSEYVMKIITELYERNCRVWYDEGIPAGRDWPKYIREHLEASSAVLFFKSAASMGSDNCYSEIKTACDSGKRIICIPIDDSTPNEKWEKALYGAEENSEPTSFSEKEYFGTREDYELKKSSWKNYYGWIVGAVGSLVVLIGMIAGLYALSIGKLDDAIGISNNSKENQPASAPTPTETPVDVSGIEDIFSEYINISFPDTTQENAVRQTLGRADGEIAETELANIKSIAICGKTIASDESKIEQKDGRWLVNGVPVADGTITDLSLIGKMVYLEKLALIDQNITEISGLESLKLLKELNLSGNPIETLKDSEVLPSLETLNIGNSGVKSLDGLKNFPSLKTVYITLDMLPIELENDTLYEVILTD